MKKYYNENIPAFAYCLLVSAAFMLVCTKSSPLYLLNDWADPNCYFTMGKSMFHGKVLYRDILDHKGPYIFLLYGLASLISSTDFLGVFLFEILSWGIFLYYNHKIAVLYLTKRQGFVMLPLLSAVILASESFYYGGSAEEFCLPLLAAGLSYFLEYFHNEHRGDGLAYRKILICGICAGILFWTKFNLLGFYFAWLLTFLLIDIRKRDVKGAVKKCLVFSGGILAASLPWLLYFGLNRSMDSLWNEYFYKNIFQYGGGENMTLVKRAVEYVLILKHNFRVNYGYFIFIFIGFCYTVLSKKIRGLQKLGICLMAGCSYLLIYIGRVWNYYALPLSVFAVLGFIALFRLISKRILMAKPAYFISLALSFIFVYFNSVNIEYLGTTGDGAFQYEIKDIIESGSDRSLLLYGVYDLGIYTLCDILPDCKYFFQNNLEDAEREKEWQMFIREGRTEYVLANENYPQTVYEQYNLVYHKTVVLEKRDLDIYLFKRK